MILNFFIKLRKRFGILRSYMIYYLKPFNGHRLKEFYSFFIQKGDLCFDIGAHLGNRSNAWLKMGAQVVAVEPQPLCIDFLSRKFGNNKNFKLVPQAVGDGEGEVTFRISSLYPTISTISTDWQFSKDKSPESLTYWDDEMKVNMTTLDRLIETYGMPDFCKIDVEDFEWEVIKGLNHQIKALSFEFFTARYDKAQMCLDKIEQLGEYEYNISFKEYLKFEYNNWLTKEQLDEIFGSYEKEISGDIYARLKSSDYAGAETP